MPTEDKPADEVQTKEASTRPCTCLGTCKGAAGLGAGWHCVIERRLPEPSQDVHTEHCCRHGCKYGDDDCTVTSGAKQQSFPCEDCEEVWDEEEEAKLDSLRQQLATLTQANAELVREREEWRTAVEEAIARFQIVEYDLRATAGLLPCKEYPEIAKVRAALASLNANPQGKE